MKRIISMALAATTLATPSLAQLGGTVLKVPQQFNDIQAAIDITALLGPNFAYTILVSDGTYDPFEIDPVGDNVSGRLVILAEEGATPIVRSSVFSMDDTVSIENLDSDDIVVLRNLELQRTNGRQSVLNVNSGEGTVWVEGCDMPAPGPGAEIPCGPSPAVDINFTGRVYLIDGLIEGINGYIDDAFTQACSGSGGIRSVGANLAIWDCEIHGGNGRPGAPDTPEDGQNGFAALDFNHGGSDPAQVRLYLSGCELEGGRGGNGSMDTSGNCGNGGHGGDGLVVSGGNYRTVWLDCTFAAGLGGAAGGPACNNGFPGQPTLKSGPSTIQMAPGVYKTIAGNTPKRDDNTSMDPAGELFVTDGEGDVGDPALIFGSGLLSVFLYVEGWRGVVVIEPNGLSFFDQIQPAGVPIPYLVADVNLVQATTGFAQAVIQDDQGGTVLSAPTAVTHIDFPN